MSAGKAKLDMKHGFMKSIIRNQFDRRHLGLYVKKKKSKAVISEHVHILEKQTLRKAMEDAATAALSKGQEGVLVAIKVVYWIAKENIALEKYGSLLNLLEDLDCPNIKKLGVADNATYSDNYDKEIKAKVQNQGKGRHKQSRHKKPDVRTYVPPFSRPQTSDQTPETSHREMRAEREQLFMLEYEDRDGHIYKRKIYKTDNPDEIAYKLGQERHLSVPYIDALAQRLAEEMEKRHDSSNSSDT